jgi:effector-binding domain-containing protein
MFARAQHGFMTEITLKELERQSTAVIRERVPMDQLRAFFDRAFSATMAALQKQGRQPVGPPFAKYYGMPTKTVDVEAGFPVSAPIHDDAGVAGGELPGGRAVEAIHVGPYEELSRTYQEVDRWMRERGLTPAEFMWESYLSDPDREPDPKTWRTQLMLPVV